MAKKKKDTKQPPLADLLHAPEGIGKKASEVEIVRWVAENIDYADPNPEECPHPFAWTLLRSCRGDVDFLIFFIKDIWTKLLPSRSQLEQGKSKEIDGKVTIKMIERIQELSDKAREKVSGKKEEIPDAFEKYDGKKEL